MRLSTGWRRHGQQVACGLCAAAFCVAAATVAAAAPDTPAQARTRAARRVVPRALTAWELAERERAALEAIPEANRTRAQYAHTMDRYRAIYHEHPGDLHAAAAVYAVAELLAEQGRSLQDLRTVRAAIAQYEFLRREYPGSSLRVAGLLAEGELAQTALGDGATARTDYELLLKDYPRSAYAEGARAGLASLNGVRNAPSSYAAGQGGAASSPSFASRAPQTRAPVRPIQPAALQSTQPIQIDPETRPAFTQAGGVEGSGKDAWITGIRHWSTPSYTRVAIDLGDSVTYEAARVPNPDRIYLDLHGTRLAQNLAGKSFTVTDEGFLKRIRTAQFSGDLTRIVLDVSDVTEYSAFLLPNPYRLIIDIHGKQPLPAREQAPASAAPAKPADASADVPAPHAAGMLASTVARPVPNTVTLKQTSTAEVAAVSDLPGRMDATSRPTSQPVSAVVHGSGSRAQGSGGGGANPKDAGGVQADEPSGVSIAQAPASAVVPGSSRAKLRRGTKTACSTVVPSAAPAKAAVPTAVGETSLVRALGLKIGRIVIDAGHGGHDSGTIGADGLEEKDVVLDVALRVGKLLHDRLGAEIIYTRSDDTFIPLETRTAIANKAQADLFLSIHANSSADPTARGVETYYLNFTSDPAAIETAARENAVSDQSIHELSDLVKKIALKDKIAESREFASDVESSLYAGLAKGNAGLKDRGVKKAPFVVLIGANMPSILAEISFVTNPRDAEQLRSPDYRERVAESLYRGVAQYEGGLSGSRAGMERASAGQ